MQQVVISSTFLDSFIKLDKASQRTVKNSINKLAIESKTSGFSIHKLERKNCDDSFRSARVNRDLRLIFLDKNDKVIMLHVGHHDDAYNWAEGKSLKVTPYGALYTAQQVVDTEVREEDPFEAFMFGGLSGPYNAPFSAPSLLESLDINQKDLMKLGIEEVVAKRLMKATNEDALLLEAESLPEELQEGVLDLATGTKNVTQLFAELFEESWQGQGDVLNNTNSKRRFYLCESAAELDRLLGNDSERWQLFLHPRQEDIVKGNYRGPVLIEGGPGTGKSIVGVHRAVHLIEQVNPGGKILFTTFSIKLSSYIREQILKLAEVKGVDPSGIEVSGADKLLRDCAVQNGLLKSRINIKAVDDLLEDLYTKVAPSRPLVFYQLEYWEVIQRLKIRSLKDYLRVDRKGMGRGLNPAERKQVWEFFEEFLAAKVEEGIWDFDDLAWAIKEGVEEGAFAPPYDSLVIDEAQDLTVPRLVALMALVRQKRNNVMILSDRNQRIFRLNTWDGDLGIRVAGRAYYLSINYRTTREIREYADTQFIKTQMDQTYLKEYKSLFSGPYPVVETFSDYKTQMKFVTNKVRQLLGLGYAPRDICIISPIDWNEIRAILTYEDIPNTFLERDVYPTKDSGVCVSSLEGCKGLEFRAVIGCNFQAIQARRGEGDPCAEDWQETLEQKRLECSKYVACTRAREELYITLVTSNG